MKRKVAIIQARMGSTRFPGKVLQNLCGYPVLYWVVKKVQEIKLVNEIVVATSDKAIDIPIVEWCQQQKINYFQGHELDVLDRFYQAAIKFKADYILRITADCPLLDSEVASQVLYLVTSGIAEYASNIVPPTWPDGLDCEAFKIEVLKQAYQQATRPSDREHVTPFIRNNQKLFKSRNVVCPIPGLYNYRWTIDTPQDLIYIEKIVTQCDGNISLYNLLNIINASPGLEHQSNLRNEGFKRSLIQERIKYCNFYQSQQLLARSLKVIPLGSQTLSKSYIQYPKNTSPTFLTHGLGGKVWDVDGNEYIDLVSGLLPNVLGYADQDVNDAIQNQLQKGITFSLSTELEIELAEKLCSIIPSAEKVRFAKNGTDVTSAAVRIARAYTQRDKMIVCGYHGWQDWYIGTTSNNKGVPKIVSKLSVAIPYNDLEQVEILLRTEEFAGIIMEPCNIQQPQIGYLQRVKDLCEKYGSLLIFDEVITGFRFALGGAQEYFKVTPHLSCFGKAMGNGMPISAVVGNADVMDEMENIFFSSTFGGETLSIVAAMATIDKIENMNVISYLWSFGQLLKNRVKELIVSYGLQNIIKLCGYDPWKILQFYDHPNASQHEIKTFFMQEMIKRGILITGSHNISFSHTTLEGTRIINAYQETFSLLAEYLEKSCLIHHIHSPIIKPLFKVRR